MLSRSAWVATIGFAAAAGASCASPTATPHAEPQVDQGLFASSRCAKSGGPARG
jgi:hypothetical protein